MGETVSYSDLEANLVGTNGNLATVSVHNPQSHAETARVQLEVSLSGGGSQTLTSSNFTLQAGGIKSVQLAASGPIGSITDGPTPIEPL